MRPLPTQRSGMLRRCVPKSRPAAPNILAASMLCVALAGCATMAGGRASSDDPLEPLNRKVLDVNMALDKAFIKPIAEAYRQVIPASVRDRVRAAIDNLAEPRIFVNDLLQGRANAAGITFNRFFINSTLGLAGLYDEATTKGFPRQTGDFGQTLYSWGVESGPYLVLLLLGPSNLRDAFGLGVDLLTTPPALVVPGHAGTVTGVAVGVVDGIDLRSRNIESLDEIIASALDFYARLKSITQQLRRAQLREARPLPEGIPAPIDPGAADAGPQR
jgi:phospholipid-binding lipoprotein MlaA